MSKSRLFSLLALTCFTPACGSETPASPLDPRGPDVSDAGASADAGSGVADGAPSDGGGSPEGFVRGSPLFFDNYNYVVTDSVNDGAANRAAFWTAGYTRIKAENVDNAGQGAQTAQTGGAGRLYTVDVSAIPGHTGGAPGSTSRALCINSLAGTRATQTDFYFRIGENLGDIPANVYFQFWVYVARSGSQQTGFHGREKFIYPTRNIYPATIANNGGQWIFQLASNSSNPNGVAAANAGEVFALSRDTTITSSTAYWNNANAISNGATSHLGQTDSSAPMWRPNQWVETRIHYDTSGANGVYEVWTRAVGNPWIKRAEWIGGTTVGGSPFTWSIDPAFRDGHRFISVPTTMPGTNTAGVYDAWIYMQDFAMASSLESLPKYDGN